MIKLTQKFIKSYIDLLASISLNLSSLNLYYSKYGFIKSIIYLYKKISIVKIFKYLYKVLKLINILLGIGVIITISEINLFSLNYDNNILIHIKNQIILYKDNIIKFIIDKLNYLISEPTIIEPSKIDLNSLNNNNDSTNNKFYKNKYLQILLFLISIYGAYYVYMNLDYLINLINDHGDLLITFLSIRKMKDIGIQTISNEELELDNLLFNNKESLTINLEGISTTPNGNTIIRKPRGEVIFEDNKYPTSFIYNEDNGYKVSENDLNRLKEKYINPFDESNDFDDYFKDSESSSPTSSSSNTIKNK